MTEEATVACPVCHLHVTVSFGVIDGHESPYWRDYCAGSLTKPARSQSPEGNPNADT